MKKDVLSQHIKNLDGFRTQYATSVSLIDRTVYQLEQLGNQIDEEIEQIDAYQRELSQTREQFAAERDRTGKVMRNFKSLLCVE